MNLTELRIGNFVTQGKKDTYRVLSVSSEAVFIELPNGGMWKNYARNIEPVPITDEWLERLGFEPDEMVKDVYCLKLLEKWHLLYLRKLKHVIFREFDNNERPNYVDTLVDTEYVHQLQNLVFALTGEELEVKDER